MVETLGKAYENGNEAEERRPELYFSAVSLSIWILARTLYCSCLLNIPFATSFSIAFVWLIR